MFFGLLKGSRSHADFKKGKSYPLTDNLPCTVSIPAVPEHRHILSKIIWSYNGAPTNGRLIVSDGGIVVLDIDITVGGPGILTLNPEVMFVNSIMVVTLYAAGSGIYGKLNFSYTTERV